MRRMSLAAAPLPFFDEATEGLTRHFGLGQFRPGQAEVISNVLARQNVVVVMPTGAGKSLCYQLPATLLPGITLVISPLIALMKDQVEQLTARGIPATYINSSLSDLERADRGRGMKDRKYKLIYVAPERFRSQSFVDSLCELGVDLFAVDEAHCISQWGHDFRPDYAQLGQIRKRLRPARTVALTATATPEVRDDIVRVLLMKDPLVFVHGFDRKNLFLEVVPVRGDDDRRLVSTTIVKEGGSGIIYCSTRKTTEQVHKALLAQGHNAVMYHAGMDDSARHKAQDAFMAPGKDVVAVATNAFGMGIDKPDIRFVVHANIPRAVEAYYQEIGRAGRDGAPARAILLFNHGDLYTQERLIQSNHPSETMLTDLWNLIWKEQTVEQSVSLLAAQIGSSEFEVSAALRVLERSGKVERGSRGEGTWTLTVTALAERANPHSADSKAILEVLKAGYPVDRAISTELSALARKAQMTPEQVRHGLTLLEKSRVVAIRRPFAGRAIRVLHKVPFRDLGLDLKRVRAQEIQALKLLRRMQDYAYTTKCRRAYLIKYFGEALDWTACEGCDVCKGSRTKKPAGAAALASPGGPSVSTLPPPYSELAVLELKRWRGDLAKDLGIPPYIIFNDKTIYALATALPLTMEDFLNVKGTGEGRWERFGPKVVEISMLARASGFEATPAVASVRRRRVR